MLNKNLFIKNIQTCAHVCVREAERSAFFPPMVDDAGRNEEGSRGTDP